MVEVTLLTQEHAKYGRKKKKITRLKHLTFPEARKTVESTTKKLLYVDINQRSMIATHEHTVESTLRTKIEQNILPLH